jgi:hypothetical protein
MMTCRVRDSILTLFYRVNPVASRSSFGRASRGIPRNDQGIFIAIVVGDFIYNSESELKIEALGPLVAPPHFRP